METVIHVGMAALAGTAVLLVGYAICKVRRLRRRYGVDDQPEDIQCVIRNFGKRPCEVVESDFDVVIARGASRVLKRVYDLPHGRWELQLEFHDGRWVAYAANYYSRYSTWLNTGREAAVHPARYLDGSDSRCRID